MGTIAKVTAGGDTHLIASTAYGTCDTAKGTVAKVATLQDDQAFTLIEGVTVHIKFAATNTSSNPTLNVNGTGAIAIKQYGTTAPGTSAATSWPAGGVVSFTYDGTYWQMNDHISDTTTSNATQIQLSGGVKSGASALIKANIIVANSDGLYKHLKEGTAFDITQPILCLTADCAANTATTNVCTEINFAVATTQSITLTAYQPVYIKGTLSGTIFTPISTTPLTQTIPSTDDGYYYIYLGYAYSTTHIRLKAEHPIYAYKNGKFGEIVNYAEAASVGDAATVNGHTVNSDVPANAVFTDTNTKVRQYLSSTNKNRPVLLAYSDNTSTDTYQDHYVIKNNSIYANPSTGKITANGFIGDASTVSGGYTVAKNVPSDADFSDTKVNQVLDSDTDIDRPLLLAYGNNANTDTNSIHQAYRNNSIYANPSTGSINCNRLSVIGGTLNLKPQNSNTNDSADIVWYYGDDSEKARIWVEDVLTASSNENPRYQAFNSSGTKIMDAHLLVDKPESVSALSTDTNCHLITGSLTGAPYQKGVIVSNGSTDACYIGVDSNNILHTAFRGNNTWSNFTEPGKTVQISEITESLDGCYPMLIGGNLDTQTANKSVFKSYDYGPYFNPKYRTLSATNFGGLTWSGGITTTSGDCRQASLVLKFVAYQSVVGFIFSRGGIGVFRLTMPATFSTSGAGFSYNDLVGSITVQCSGGSDTKLGNSYFVAVTTSVNYDTFRFVFTSNSGGNSRYDNTNYHAYVNGSNTDTMDSSYRWRW